MADKGEEDQLLMEEGTGNEYGSSPSPPSDPSSDKVELDKALYPFEIIAILSTSFAYGCIMTTLFLITLPVECSRIQRDHPEVEKSISLAMFVAIAGVTQLVAPLAGMLSDIYKPPAPALGQRLPYLVLGSILTVIGLFGQILASEWSFWVRYSFAFFLHMIGLNIIYSMMIALIPDQVPEGQTGMANGTLALLLVTGSLFGFGLFHSVFNQSIFCMYGLYICIVIFTSILTCAYAQDRDVAISEQRHGRPSQEHHKLLNVTLLLKTMLYDPLTMLDWSTLGKSYTIDTTRYHDFFIVTVSRTFYYMGISVQTFFMYYLHDVIKVAENPEAEVATLAILGQITGAFTCYPVGFISDRFLGGHRKPFVYLACAILAASTLSLIFCTELNQVIIVACVLGGSNGMYLTMDTSLAVDTLPNEDPNDPDASGHAQLLGVWGVAGFVGSALGPLLGGPMLFLFGQTGEPPAEGDDAIQGYSISGYTALLSLSASYFLCSALVLRLVSNPQI